MKEKKGFLRWPWNVVVYVLLVAALRLFAVPIILYLMWLQKKNNPHGVAEGYCLSRTRKRLTWLIWSLLVLLLAGGMLVMLWVGLGQDRTNWETMDYITLALCGAGGPLFLLGGFYLAYVAIRDSFFPARSSLAKSIRNQLPYPEEAPPVEELFAMVDRDLEENGQWFGPVGIGREWVLGDGANRIDRIRGIFVINEIHQHHTNTGVRTSRNMELVLIDDRWQRTGTSFNNLQDLQAAAECLALRVPDARRGNGSQCTDFWTMDESGKEDFQRWFRQRQNLRASESVRKEALSQGPQDMILKRQNGEVTSRVSDSLVEETLRRCLEGEESGFELIPTRPVRGGERTFRSLKCFAKTKGEAKVRLLLEMVPSQGEENLGLTLWTDPRRAEEILRGWLRREIPELKQWELQRVYAAPPAAGPRERKRTQAKLSLVYASGAAENHTTFTEEDVQMAAEGLLDGTFQLVDLTHSSGYLWLRVTAGDKTDARCTVEATRPDGEELGFYVAKMPPREAAAWLTGYPHGQFLPGGRNWKRVQTSK